MGSQPTDLEQLRAALAAGEKDLRSLKLGEIDGLDLDLSGCNLDGSCFKEARFGHATLRGAQAVSDTHLKRPTKSDVVNSVYASHGNTNHPSY